MRIIILAVLICACQAAQDPENCRPPQFQNNGFFVPNSENYRTGDKITYGCNTGLKPDLKTWWGEITCKNGEWSHTPRCIDETWCITTHVPNAKPDVLQAAAPGKYDFECDHGYWIEGGKSIAECVAGSWTLPECKRKSNSCAPPPRVYNGMITTPYRSMFENGEKIEYICARGYRLYGDKTNTCEQGTWSSNPSCVNVQCNQPHVANARTAEGFKISYNHGETVRFTCNRGYKFEGTDTARCEDGTWKLPVCKVEVKCTNQPHVANARTAEGFKISYNHGETVRYTCNRGYKFEGTDTARCEDGTWKLPVCKVEVKCTDQPHVANARTAEGFKFSYNHGETVRYTCNRGYKFEGTDTARCEDGTWKLPVCKVEVKCTDQPHVANARTAEGFKFSYNHGETVRYTCNRGYKFEGTDTARCEDGTWKLPVCKVEVKCTDQPHVANARTAEGFKFSYNHGETVRYTCNRGYKFEGTDTARCEDGTWKLPVCKVEVKCTDQPHVANARTTEGFKFSYNHGETVRFICRRGYEFKGTDTARCEDGTWKLPVCKVELKCTNQPYVAYARAAEGFKISYNHGETVRFICNSPYEFEGTDTARCEEGIWKLPVCKVTGGGSGGESLHPDQLGVLLPVRDCGSHPLIVNGDVIEMPSGKELKVQCKRYYKLEGPKTVGCVKGEWTPLPECKPPCRVEGKRIHSSQSDEYLQEGEEKIFHCAVFKKITVRCTKGTTIYSECKWNLQHT
ncbi:complement factor H-like isoform 1-T1 [Clarias gariepinus]